MPSGCEYDTLMVRITNGILVCFIMKGASYTSYNCNVISNNVRMYSLQVVNGEIALCGNLGLRMRIAMRKGRNQQPRSFFLSWVEV